MAPVGVRHAHRLPFTSRRNRGGEPQADAGTTADATGTDSLPDRTDDVPQLLFNRLCSSDSLALADVSTGWQTACAIDARYVTAAAAVLPSAGTPTECNEFVRTRLGPPSGTQRNGRLLVVPLVPQATKASQGRLILLCLRVVASLIKSYKALDLAAPGPWNALGWADNRLPFSPKQLARLLACVRLRNDDGMSAWEARQVWGIRLDICWVDSADVHGVKVSGGEMPEVLFNCRAALRVVFIDMGNDISPVGVTQRAAMKEVLTNLRRRARRVLVARRLVLNYTGKDVTIRAGPRGRRQNLRTWMSMAKSVEHSPILKFLYGALTVDEAHAAALLGFLPAIYDQVAISWPKMERHRACTHWAPVERHVVRVAVCAFSFGDTSDTFVADVTAHMACLGVARVCISLGRRLSPLPLRSRCGIPFLAGCSSRLAIEAPCCGRCSQGAGERAPSDVGHTPAAEIDVGTDYIRDGGGDEWVEKWRGASFARYVHW